MNIAANGRENGVALARADRRGEHAVPLAALAQWPMPKCDGATKQLQMIRLIVTKLSLATSQRDETDFRQRRTTLANGGRPTGLPLNFTLRVLHNHRSVPLCVSTQETGGGA